MLSVCRRPPKTPRKATILRKAQGAAVGTENTPLADWLDTCPAELTDEAQADILAMIEATKPE